MTYGGGGRLAMIFSTFICVLSSRYVVQWSCEGGEWEGGESSLTLGGSGGGEGGGEGEGVDMGDSTGAFKAACSLANRSLS